MPLRPDFTFNRFIRTRSSVAALRLAVCVAEGRSHAPRVLFLHGPAGVGKTHLLHAVTQAATARRPSARVRIVEANELCAQLVAAIRRDRILEVRQEFAAIDLLLIDDLHVLVEKPGMQTEVGWLVRACVDRRGRTVIASGVALNGLPALARTLRTIGMVRSVALKAPDAVDMRRLLDVLLAQEASVLRRPVLTRLVRQSGGDIRRLVGAATCLRARFHLAALPITVRP